MLLILPAVLMQFMGDQPKPRGKNDLELLYELLKVSKSLRAESCRETVCPEDLFLSSHLGLFATPSRECKRQRRLLQ